LASPSHSRHSGGKPDRMTSLWAIRCDVYLGTRRGGRTWKISQREAARKKKWRGDSKNTPKSGDKSVELQGQMAISRTRKIGRKIQNQPENCRNRRRNKSSLLRILEHGRGPPRAQTKK